MIRRVTLDTNCLLDLDKDTERTPSVRNLIARHDSGAITLSIPAVMASERQRGGVSLSNFAEFTDRLARLGVGHLPLLPPMKYYGVSFWDHALWADEAWVARERQIHEILHPMIEFDYAHHCQKLGIDPDAKPPEGKWRNAKCDVQVFWSHVYHGGELLVTDDKNFVQETKRSRLLALGAGEIVRTLAAPSFLDDAP